MHAHLSQLDVVTALWTAAFEHAFDPMVLLDAQGCIVDWNPQAKRCFGWLRDEVLGLPLHEVILPPTEHTAYLDLLRQCKDAEATRPSVHRECPAIHRNRTGVTVELQMHAVGSFSEFSVLVTLRDVSERRQTEEALRIAESAFQTLEGLVVTDANKVIVRVNEAFTQITGYGADEALGKVSAVFRVHRKKDEPYHAMRSQLPVANFWQGEVWDRRKNGESYPAWLRVSAVTNSAGVINHYVVAFVDNSQQHRSHERIQHLAFFDSLTGLPNRRLLLDRLSQILAASARQREFGALLLIDLDHFHDINDALGHDVGDALLVQFANRIRECVHADDTVARIGGDEYVVVLQGLAEKQHAAVAKAEKVAERLRDALEKAYFLKDHEVQATPSIGVALFHGVEVTPELLVKHAETAMYRSKSAGRNCVRFFDAANQSSLEQRFTLNTWMRKGLPSEFDLHYQLQVDRKKRPVGAEALIRWKHPSRGFIAPNLFIPLAEETGFIVQLGAWVLDTACRQLALWSQSLETKTLTLAVNVSARQFHVPGFVDSVESAVLRNGAVGSQLKLELTEGVMLHDIAEVIRNMHALKELGVQFSIDDFGTGYSSLSYLKRLPLNQLKIDQSFVRDLMTDANDVAIARSIVSLGHSLGLEVIAEGVETPEQLNALVDMQCDAFQGYFFGRPVAQDEFRDQLHAMQSPAKHPYPELS